jgi:hypothetical protein
MSALIASAGISSGFGAISFTFHISVFAGSLQLIGSSVSAGGMFGGVFRAVIFSSYLFNVLPTLTAVPQLL